MNSKMLMTLMEKANIDAKALAEYLSVSEYTVNAWLQFGHNRIKTDDVLLLEKAEQYLKAVAMYHAITDSSFENGMVAASPFNLYSCQIHQGDLLVFSDKKASFGDLVLAYDEHDEPIGIGWYTGDKKNPNLICRSGSYIGEIPSGGKCRVIKLSVRTWER